MTAIKTKNMGVLHATAHADQRGSTLIFFAL